VALDGEQCAGFITVVVKDTGCSQIELFGVSEKHLRMGVGLSLLRSAESWCLEEECRSTLVATQSENLPACRLYEKYGFKRKVEFGIFHSWTNSTVE